jgi:16S rRNA processing protein RimM
VAEQPTHLAVGHVSRPHGTRGEVYVRLLTDHPESVFALGVVLRTAGEEGEAPDPDFPPLRIESTRPFQGGVLVHFAGITTRAEAERLQGRYLVSPIETLPALEEGELFFHQLIGMRVRTLEGREIGVVEEVYELEPADLLEVRGPEGTFLIPFSERIVREVDVEGGGVVIDPPEGLLEL